MISLNFANYYLIEEESGKLHGYEFKWGLQEKRRKHNFRWLDSYQLITRKNLK